MMNTENQNLNSNYIPAKTLPNSTLVLVLGIVSIVGCVMYGLPGIVCGILAISKHKEDKKVYEANPLGYEASYKNSKIGKICGVVGLSLSILFLLIMIVYFYFIFSMIGGHNIFTGKHF